MACRRALREAHKHVVNEAMKTAHVSCMSEHRARHLLAQQALERICNALHADINILPHNMQLILAALTYAQSEVLWYFQHVNEVGCFILQVIINFMLCRHVMCGVFAG